MPITRQDAWTEDEDLMLAETVLRHIREGGTQLKAFEEVGKKLSRTGAACGFRWNSYVRKQYQSGIELAKRQRKELKKQAKKLENTNEVPKQVESVEVSKQPEKLTFYDVKNYLQALYEKAETTRTQKEEISRYEYRIKELEEKIIHLSNQNKKLKEEITTIEGDHRALVEIMERARRMVGTREA